jgi:SpoVK/Ycf46/Vps4 family AAA+-type ATPase
MLEENVSIRNIAEILVKKGVTGADLAAITSKAYLLGVERVLTHIKITTIEAIEQETNMEGSITLRDIGLYLDKHGYDDGSDDSNEVRVTQSDFESVIDNFISSISSNEFKKYDEIAQQYCSIWKNNIDSNL